MTACDACRGIRWCESCSDSKKPLRCRLRLHDWSCWTWPANYRHCFRCGHADRQAPDPAQFLLLELDRARRENQSFRPEGSDEP